MDDAGLSGYSGPERETRLLVGGYQLQEVVVGHDSHQLAAVRYRQAMNVLPEYQPGHGSDGVLRLGR